MDTFAAARDAVGEEPIAAGGAQKFAGLEFREADSERSSREAGRNSEPNAKTKMKFLPPPVTPSERNRSAWAVGSF
jgi:hypothetical protein